MVPAKPRCEQSPWPLDFVYDRKEDKFNLDPYRSDEDLLMKVRTGKGDERFLYTGYKNIYIEIFFAGTTPEFPE